MNKFIVTSDTHENEEAMLALAKFAKDNGISQVFDAGDLQGCIGAFKGVHLDALYTPNLDNNYISEDRFTQEVTSIGGTVRQGPALFEKDGLLFLMKHDIAQYNHQPYVTEDEGLNLVRPQITKSEYAGLDKYVLFGHTHEIYFEKTDHFTAINPGSLGIGFPSTFAVVDLETKSVQYRTVDKLIINITPESGITKLKSADFRRQIIGFKDGLDALVINRDGTYFQTPKFKNISFGCDKGDHVDISLKSELGVCEDIIVPESDLIEVNYVG